MANGGIIGRSSAPKMLQGKAKKDKDKGDAGSSLTYTCNACGKELSVDEVGDHNHNET